MLADLGVDPARMQVVGYGEAFPVTDNASNRGRAQNRRVEIVFSNDRASSARRAENRAPQEAPVPQRVRGFFWRTGWRWISLSELAQERAIIGIELVRAAIRAA